MQSKKCTKCHAEKTLEHFNKAKNGMFGKAAICKCCENLKYLANKDKILKRSKEKYESNKEVYSARHKDYCEKNKEAIAEKSSIKTKRYREENREKCLEKEAAYRENNIDKIKGYKEKYEESNKSLITLRRIEYYENNKEAIKLKSIAWSEDNLEKVQGYKRKWKKKNPQAGAARRAAKLSATPRWVLQDEWNDFVVQETYILAKLRSEILCQPFHVDHIVPLVSDKVCGLHWHANLQVIHAETNLSKGNRYWPHMPEGE